jgi:hypothetical protein
MMTELEEELRIHFRTVADGAQEGLVRPLRTPPARRGSGLIRWLAPISAVAAVAGLIAGITIVSHAERMLPSSQDTVASMPKYYVTLNLARRGGKQVLLAVVRASATGATISSVQVLSTVPFQPVTVSAAANDRAFLISGVLPAELDVLRLSPDGHVRQLVRFPQKIFKDNWGGMLSPDGADIVQAVESCPHAGNPVGCDFGVTMKSATTGATEKTWLMPKGAQAVVLPVNWPTGHDLFIAVGDGYRLLDVAGPAGSVLASSRPVRAVPVPHGWVGEGEVLLPGDKLLLIPYAQMSSPSDGKRLAAVRIDVTPVSSGAGRVLYAAITPVKASTFVAFCTPLSLGPEQIHVLLACPGGFGRLDGSRFTPLPGLSTAVPLRTAAAW